MKNYEKYADEIKKFDGNPDFCEQKILKPLGKSCEATDCCYCNLLKIVWLLGEYEEPEVDWSKVEVDTPILVRQTEDKEWSTPKALFDELNEEFGFTLDPCSTDNNHLCDKYYTIHEDGLEQSWGG